MKKYINKAIANILVGIIIIAILGMAGYITLTKTKPPQKPILPITQQQTTEPTTSTPLFQSKTQPQTKIESTNEIDTTNWKTYRNEKYRFEFKYPDKISDKSVFIKEKNINNSLHLYGSAININLALFESKIPTDKFYKSTDGGMEQDYVNFFLDFLIYDLKKFSFPETNNKGENNNNLIIGMDLGGMGGYIYNPQENKWYSRDDNKKISWDSIFQYLKESKPKELPILKTTDNLIAYPYDGSAFEDYWCGYKIFDVDRFIYIGISYPNCGYYYPEPQYTIKNQLQQKHKEILNFMKGVSVSLKFL